VELRPRVCSRLTRLSKKTILLNMRLESKPWGEKYADMFCSEVPVEVQRALLHGLFRNYSDASEHCYTVFRHPIARNASGPYRHSKIEDDWCGIAERFASENRNRPAFAKVRFPNRRFSGYIGKGVDLWTRFADIVGQFIDVKNDFTKPAPVKPRTPVKEEQA